MRRLTCRLWGMPQEELGTPALAFVRAVCDALALDSAVEDDVTVLRRNLLLLTHTLEFAPTAQFKVCPVHHPWIQLLTLDTMGPIETAQGQVDPPAPPALDAVRLWSRWLLR